MKNSYIGSFTKGRICRQLLGKYFFLYLSHGNGVASLEVATKENDIWSAGIAYNACIARKWNNYTYCQFEVNQYI